jgi:FkbM family methyltransferase
VKSFVRQLLNRTSLRHRINDTRLYRAYLRLAHPSHAAKETRVEQLCSALFREVGNQRVFDIGANHGNKAALFARLAQEVICIEPDPNSMASLRARFARNPRIEFVHAGVGDTAGKLPFHIVQPGSALNTFSPRWAEQQGATTSSVMDIPVVTLDQLIQQHGPPNYVKIDAEGFELPILQGLSQPVPLLSFECNLPEFLTESLGCVDRLVNLDFGVEFNYSTTEAVMVFAEPAWIDAGAMRSVLQSGQFRFLEVFAKMKSVS